MIPLLIFIMLLPLSVFYVVLNKAAGSLVKKFFPQKTGWK